MAEDREYGVEVVGDSLFSPLSIIDEIISLSMIKPVRIPYWILKSLLTGYLDRAGECPFHFSMFLGGSF